MIATAHRSIGTTAIWVSLSFMCIEVIAANYLFVEIRHPYSPPPPSHIMLLFLVRKVPFCLPLSSSSVLLSMGQHLNLCDFWASNMFA